MKPALLILAAGIGSRYGGVKQMDGIGPEGESIIDYSVFDAIRAGFGRIVFVINRKIEKDFTEVWRPKLQGKIDHSFVIQDPEDLPEGFILPPDRIKPWGTGQAVLAARHEIKTPFAVINADDFYGFEAYKMIRTFLSVQTNEKACCMVGFQLQNTLSDHGTVSRGICKFDDQHYLEEIREITNIEKNTNEIGYMAGDNKFIALEKHTPVSMNIWGFKPLIFSHLEEGFRAFLKEGIAHPKSEYLLPAMINELVHKEMITVKMLETGFKGFGVTYREDKERTKERIQGMITEGEYPSNLWKFNE